MVGDRTKGKIPHSEWPKIIARYHAGETIAQIGRQYGCTAPAIRYIIKRTGNQTAAPPEGLPNESRLRPPSTGPALHPDASAVIDRMLGAELRKRVSGDIASFLVALDQVVLEGTIGSAADLEEAADRLMRSVSRVRIELERLLASGEPGRRKSGAVKTPGALPSRA